MTIARVRATLADPNFDAHDPSGLLKSDPGLLYYLVERVVEAGGSAPDDWRADPRIEHPATYDVPAHLPTGQEFVVAWLRLAIGDALPLHVFCLWVSSACASLVLAGVWLLAFELTSSAWLALLSAALAAALPATWRTLGFVLMDEDFSLPFFALHLGLLARALRVRTPTSIALATIALGLALATWHAMNFFAALEALSLVAWCAWANVNPLRARGAWLAPVILFAFGLGVPFLRASGFACSLAMVCVVALWLAALGEHWTGRRFGLRVLLVLAFVVSGLIAFAANQARSMPNEYAHVFGLIAAKVQHLGVLPDDPRTLTPDVRLMWQGPFATLDASAAWMLLGLALILVPLAVRVSLRSLRPESDSMHVRAWSWFACCACAAAWLISRTVVLPAILLPALVAPLVASILASARARVAIAAFVGVQALIFGSWIANYSNPWYAAPVQRQAEIAALLHAIPALVPEDAAIAADSMNSTAILAHTRRRAILSPKWESSASRARVVEFLNAFYTLNPAAFRELIVQRYQCRYLLVDRFTLGYLSRYAAGCVTAEPRPGTAASAFLSRDASVLENVPGFELIYRSPITIRQSDGSPTDFFRLYALAP